MISKKLVAASAQSGGVVPASVLINSGANEAASIDISNVASMSVIDTISSTDLSLGYGYGLDINERVVYFLNTLNDSVTSLDFSNSSSLAVLDTYSNATTIDSASHYAVDGDRNVVFVGNSASYRITSLDITNPSSISLTQSALFSHYTRMMALDKLNDVLYVGWLSSLSSIDVSDPSNMTLISTKSLFSSDHYGPEFVGYVDPTGTKLITISSVNNAVCMFDVTNPASISLLGSVKDATNIPDVTFLNVDWSNNVAFVLGDGYLSSIDISNTSSLSRLDTLYDASFIGTIIETIAVDAARNVLFVGARSNGDIVKAVDYSTPTALTIAGSITNSALTGGSVVIR